MGTPLTRMPSGLLVLDLVGVFVFALDGALTGQRAARLDIVGSITLAMVTALGGGVLRDVLIGAIPPAALSDWRYLTVATVGGLVAFGLGERLRRLAVPITVLDAAGLGLFAVTGAGKALEHGLGPGQAVILGAVTAVGGGTMRDVLVRRVPAVLQRRGLYAIPAIIGAGLAVTATRAGVYGPVTAVGAAAVCFAVRMASVRYGLRAPGASGAPRRPPDIVTPPHPDPGAAK